MKTAPSEIVPEPECSLFPGISSEKTLEDLLVRIQGDDCIAFEALFNQMYKPLCRFCERLVFLKEVAEEVVSDVFCAVWRNRKALQIRNVKAYMYRAVHNGAHDYLRARKRIYCSLEHASHLPAESFTLHEMMEHREYEALLGVHMKRLPRACKAIFKMSREEGMKYRDIASALNISVKTVETQLSKALRELRKVRACN